MQCRWWSKKGEDKAGKLFSWGIPTLSKASIHQVVLLWASLKEAPTQSLAYAGNRIWFLGGNSRAVARLKFITAEKGRRVGGPKEHSFTQYKSNFPGGLASSGMTLPPRTHTG